VESVPPVSPPQRAGNRRPQLSKSHRTGPACPRAIAPSSVARARRCGTVRRTAIRVRPWSAPRRGYPGGHPSTFEFRC